MSKLWNLWRTGICWWQETPYARTGQRERAQGREQLLPSVHSKGVKQLHISDDQQASVQNLIMAWEMVCEPKKKKSSQILMKSQNWNWLSKNLDWKILHDHFSILWAATFHSQSLKAKWPFLQEERQYHYQKVNWRSFICTFVSRCSKTLWNWDFFPYLDTLMLFLNFNT